MVSGHKMFVSGVIFILFIYYIVCFFNRIIFYKYLLVLLQFSVIFKSFTCITVQRILLAECIFFKHFQNHQINLITFTTSKCCSCLIIYISIHKTI